MAVRSATVRMGRRVEALGGGGGMTWQERVMAAACVGLLAAAFWIGLSLKGMSVSIHGLETQAARLQARHAALLKERARLTARPELERLGRRLGLHPPRPSELVVLRGR